MLIVGKRVIPWILHYVAHTGSRELFRLAVLAIALGVAAVGWGLDTQTAVESDLTKLVPQDLAALTDLQALQKSTDVGGELDVVVDSDRLTDPAVVGWMARYQQDVLRRFGYSAKRGCGKAEVCPAFSLPDLVQTSGGKTTRAQIEGLLAAVPSYFSQGVITGDHHTATLAFGIRLMPLDRQEKVIQEMRRRLHPPAGVRAELAGLPVLAAEANARIASPWRRMASLLAGLLAVALVLFAAFRRWERALVPLVPIALATGWSALVLFALRIPLNPMSVTLGALVIAISTEFSVLLSERFRAERGAGHDPAEALRRTYRSTGAAVLASGTTAIAGFAVLVVSDIRMLRDFGFVTVVDLTVSLAGVMVVLPAVLLLAEGRGLLDAPARIRSWRPRRRRARVERAPAA
jgi:predicted RND superfamily exporter protein